MSARWQRVSIFYNLRLPHCLHLRFLCWNEFDSSVYDFPYMDKSKGDELTKCDRSSYTRLLIRPCKLCLCPLLLIKRKNVSYFFLLLLYFRRRHTNPTILKKVLVLWNFSEKIKKWASIAFLWSIFFFHRYFRLCFFHFGSLHAQTLYWMRPTTASHISVVRTEEHTLNAKRTNEQNKQKSFFTIQMKNSTSIYFQFLLLPGAAVAALSPSISSSCQLISFFVYVCVCVYVQCRQVVYILCWYSR